MDFKKEIGLLLKDLKTNGYDRRTIERELGYKEKSIDQILSKGGNETFYNTLRLYSIEKGGKSNTEKVAKKQYDKDTGTTVENLAVSNKFASEAALVSANNVKLIAELFKKEQDNKITEGGLKETLQALHATVQVLTDMVAENLVRGGIERDREAAGDKIHTRISLQLSKIQREGN